MKKQGDVRVSPTLTQLWRAATTTLLAPHLQNAENLIVSHGRQNVLNLRCRLQKRSSGGLLWSLGERRSPIKLRLLDPQAR